MSKFLYAVLFNCAVLSCHAQPSQTSSRGESRILRGSLCPTLRCTSRLGSCNRRSGIWLASLRHLSQGRGGSDAVDARNGRPVGSP